MRLRRFTAALLCAGLHAQEPGLPNQDPAALAEESGPEASASRWRVSLGAMALGLPTYPGSGEGRVVLLPVFRAEYGKRLYLGSSRLSVGFGGGVHLVNSGHWAWDLGLGIGERRREGRADTLAGMGDRRADLWAGTGLHLRQGPFRVGLTFAAGLGEAAGTRSTLSVGFAGRLAARWFGGVGLTATAADAKHMAYAFGVDPEQAAARTRLLVEGDPRLRPGEDRAYAPGSGLQDLALGAHLAWVVDRHWRAFGLLRFAQLLDAAKQSPLVREDSDATVGLGFSYRF